LDVETPEVHWSVEPLEVAALGARQVEYLLWNGYVFEQGYVANAACGDRFTPRQSFALLQVGPRQE
jgi:hypothetical protein